MAQLLDKTTDQRIVHHGRTWEQFKLIQKGFEGSPGVRLFYYHGTIEILMPGEDHEFFKPISLSRWYSPAAVLISGNVTRH